MKRWFQSKTLWTNLVATLAFFVTQQFGVTIPNEVLVSAMAVINMILRFVSRTELTA